MPKKKTEAEILHAQRTTAIEQKLRAIQGLVREHGKGEAINWGHAGSLGHVLDVLESIVNFLSGRMAP